MEQKINKKILKKARDLRLVIINYHGFVRGRVWDGDMSHCGMWELEVLPEHETNEDESMGAGGFNINEVMIALDQAHKYFYGPNEKD